MPEGPRLPKSSQVPEHSKQSPEAALNLFEEQPPKKKYQSLYSETWSPQETRNRSPKSSTPESENPAAAAASCSAFLAIEDVGLAVPAGCGFDTVSG